MNYVSDVFENKMVLGLKWEGEKGSKLLTLYLKNIKKNAIQTQVGLGVNWMSAQTTALDRIIVLSYGDFSNVFD